MNRSEIEKILPHRAPMLLVDEAETGEDGSAIGYTPSEAMNISFRGIFPGNPVVPGVILCEMMAQTCAVLLANHSSGKTPYFTSLNNVRFKNVVKPGDTIEFRCRITKRRDPFCFAEGRGTVGGKLSVQGEFSFALLGGE